MVERAQAALLLGRVGEPSGYDDLIHTTTGEDVLEQIRDDLATDVDLLAFTPEEWTEAHALSLALLNASVDRARRFFTVQDIIAEGAERGAIAFGIRSRLGGLMRLGNAEWWGTRLLYHRFKNCRIDPDHPLSDATPDFETGYELFVSREGIAQFLADISENRSSNDANAFNPFWSNEMRPAWPGSSREYLFLGEAVLQLGKAMFPLDWTDAAPGFALTSDEVGARAQETIERLAQEAAAANITFFLKAYQGGGYTACPADWWATKEATSMLVRCEIDPLTPNDPVVARERGMPLFVERSGFRNLLSSLVSRPVHVMARSPRKPISAVRRRNGDRTNVLRATLSIYRVRLLNRETVRMKKMEAIAVWNAWTSPPAQPKERHIGTLLTPYHRLCEFGRNNVITSESADRIVALIDFALAEIVAALAEIDL